MQGANLNAARLVSAKLKKADLRGARFQQASLQSAHFENAKLAGARFEQANLNDAFFKGASFDDTALRSILRSANWQKAHFERRTMAKLKELAEERGTDPTPATISHPQPPTADLSDERP
jgi:uncharacterized protein YjbI with pentapeptide repeats